MEIELTGELLVRAYAQGIFPMGMEDGEIGWFSPDPRAIIPLDGFRVSTNLRRRYESGKFELTVSRDFSAVIAACGDREEGTWISDEIVGAYTQLHEMNMAHSVEAWVDGELAGGLYGVCLGGAFFGESMFYRMTDASKVALVHLVERMRAREMVLLDVQFVTGHLKRFGAIEIPREEYLRRLQNALSLRCDFAD